MYWSIRSSSRKGGDGVNGVDIEYRYFRQRRWCLKCFNNFMVIPKTIIQNVEFVIHLFNKIYKKYIFLVKKYTYIQRHFKKIETTIFYKVYYDLVIDG